MKRLYDLLLKSKYVFDNYYSEKSFSFKLIEGEWTKSINISKYSSKYKVSGYEGLSNCIKTFAYEFDKYKDVIKYLEL